MRPFPAVCFVAVLAACSPTSTPDVNEARADGTPVAPPTTLAVPAAVPEAVAKAHHGGMPSAAEVAVKAVDRAAGPEGRTVAEVHAQRKALADRKVAVRGTVVKFLPGIMGRNWVHLRDGSGSAETSDHDLTLTTAAEVKVGTVVVGKGLVRADKDFGSGYAYQVIVEEAEFTSEP